MERIADAIRELSERIAETQGRVRNVDTNRTSAELPPPRLPKDQPDVQN